MESEVFEWLQSLGPAGGIVVVVMLFLRSLRTFINDHRQTQQMANEALHENARVLGEALEAIRASVEIMKELQHELRLRRQFENRKGIEP